MDKTIVTFDYKSRKKYYIFYIAIFYQILNLIFLNFIRYICMKYFI